MSNIEHHVNQLRREAVLGILYESYPNPVGDGLLLKGAGADLSPTKQNIRGAVEYLVDTGLATKRDRAGLWVIYITPKGLDAYAAEHEPEGLRIMLAMLRLRLLSNLSLGRGGPALGLPLLVKMLREDEDLDRDNGAVLRGLCYLTELGLVRQDGDDLWSISAAGVDFLENEGPAYDGILQPPEL